jgi:hypothetical protein
MQACAINLYNYSDTAVSQLNCRKPDRRQVSASYTSCAWLLLVHYHVHLDLCDLGLLLPVSCMILFYSHTLMNFVSHMQLADSCVPVKGSNTAEYSVLQSM